ncbi:MAG: GxxExxY protein, partial [Planctomycetota bacterium]
FLSQERELAMPITCDLPLRILNQAEFGAIAFDVMHHAFEIHNEMGRFFDEPVYQEQMQQRLGQRADREVIVRATYLDFEKPFRLDLVVDRGGVFELKTVAELHDSHRSQLIHYLMMTGLEHGKLINFRPDKIEHEFVNSLESQAARRSFDIKTLRWTNAVPCASRMQEVVTGFLRDWGTGLDLQLYTDAVTHFFGGRERVEQDIEVMSRERRIGRQTVRLVDSNTAFKLTALHRDLDAFESHTRRFLEHTRLERVLWVNMVLSEVSFTSIEKK